MTINLLRKPANKTFNPSASGTKMQMHHLSSPCGLVRIQPITSWGISRGRSRVAGRGRGAPRSSTQSSTRSYDHEQMGCHAARKQKAHNYSFRQAISDTDQNPPCSTSMAITQAFAQNRPIADPYKFTRNPHKQSCKKLVIHSQACGKHFGEFGAISGTYQNPPSSKPWAIAQAFCSKSANFGPLQNHPKSTQTILQAVSNPFASM